MSMKSLPKASKAKPTPINSPSFAFDRRYGEHILGIDEVGRGPLAGPVIASCAYIPKNLQDHPIWQSVTDSKKLSLKKREFIYETIKDLIPFGLGEASCQEIDTLNIHHATLLAMKRAFGELQTNLSQEYSYQALIDGKFAPDIAVSCHTVVKGDSTSLSIAAASIIAKVTRDRLMVMLHQEHPYYGWNKNAGYGTKEHRQAIDIYGITPHHRLSFEPCKSLSRKVRY